jgi:hypothetical protein
MKRLALIAFVSLSLLLCSSISFLWIRGQFARDSIWYTPSNTRYSIHSHRGKIWLWSLTAVPTPTAMVWTSPARMQPGLVFDSAPDSWYDQFAGNPMWTLLPKDLDDTPAYGATTDHRFLGFRLVRADTWYPRAQLMHGYPTAVSKALYIPHWFLLILTTVPAGWVFSRVLRARHRRRRRLCPACAYDIRATPSRCPECGTAPA